VLPVPVPTYVKRLGENTDFDFFGFVFSNFWRHSNVDKKKSDRISGIRLLDLPDIQLNQYPVHP
jgi:hypothetical protein